MTSLLKTVFLTMFVAGVSCHGDLGQGIEEELVKIVTGTLVVTGQCDPANYTDINFLLYTRSNPDNPITLDPYNVTQVDPNKKVIILIHGWLSSPTTYGFPKIKDAALQRYDCNLIMVDWSQIAFQLYTTSYCKVPSLGGLVGQFLCLLSAQLDIPLSSVHVVGLSLGAQMAGYIGRYTNATCAPIGRITGLDPAGPGYQGLDDSQLLHKTDAIFVDIIHTNEGQLGICGNYGDVDFHVNCGTQQNGCHDINITNFITNITNGVENIVLSLAGCNHLRSAEYYAESLNSDNFIAKSCKTCPTMCSTAGISNVCVADNINASYIIMGEDCPTNPPRSVYWIPTNSESPYAEGCAAYPLALGCS